MIGNEPGGVFKCCRFLLPRIVRLPALVIKQCLTQIKRTTQMRARFLFVFINVVALVLAHVCMQI